MRFQSFWGMIVDGLYLNKPSIFKAILLNKDYV